MKPFKLRHKITAISLAILLGSVSLSSINEHTYTIGLDNFHKEKAKGLLFNCWGSYTYHSSYNCGKAFHISYYN